MDKKTFASGAIWKILEAFSGRGISLIISIVLARILLPEDYGIVTLTAVFINLSIIFVQSGLTTALVRKDRIDEVDYNNGFLIGFGIALACYGIFFFAAPRIADFYSEPLLVPVLRVQMLSLFLVAIGNINNVIITREFRFRELCIAGIIANLISGLIGIILAYWGFGVWALVLYTLLRDGILSLVIILRVRWHPGLKYDKARMKSLLHFSVWVLSATLLDYVGNNFSSTVLGKKYSLSELGLYAKGNQIPEMICLYTFGAISSVLLPTLSIYQHDTERLKHVCKRMVELSAYIILPMMMGLGLIASKLIPFLFTDKWSLCTPVFVFACISYGVNPFRTINIQLIYALGNSKTSLLIEGIRTLLLVTGTLICVFVLKTSIYGVACVGASVALINVLITQYFAKKYIGYTYAEWFSDMLPAIKLSLLMSVLVYMAGFLPLNKYLLMFIQVAVGGISYIGLSEITKNNSYLDVKAMLLEKINGMQIQTQRES